jgi:hypothetical protein
MVTPPRRAAACLFVTLVIAVPACGEDDDGPVAADETTPTAETTTTTEPAVTMAEFCAEWLSFALDVQRGAAENTDAMASAAELASQLDDPQLAELGENLHEYLTWDYAEGLPPHDAEIITDAVFDFQNACR